MNINTVYRPGIFLLNSLNLFYLMMTHKKYFLPSISVLTLFIISMIITENRKNLYGQPSNRETICNPACQMQRTKSIKQKQNIMFLKTHKTASSTLQNILIRYAYNNDRFVGLPQLGHIFGMYSGASFTPSMMFPLPESGKVNMLLHHMVFDYEEVSSVLPPDSVFITILREPATQFESAFQFFKHKNAAFGRVKHKHAMNEYLSNPSRYFKGPKDGQFWGFGKNNVFFDLGFNSLSDDNEYISESISIIENKFDLVLIAEYFDTSLLLLKDLLGWEMNDIVYLSLNARERNTVRHLTSEDIDLIYQWNKADVAVYQHFNKTIRQRVKKYGRSRMREDLKMFQTLKSGVTRFCVDPNICGRKELTEHKYKMFNPRGVKIAQYKLNDQAIHNETCQELIYPEYTWYQILLDKEYPMRFDLFSKLTSSII
ncbi:galactosylceramide sulfotransferase-like isoform X1 [Styela clava]